MTPEQRQHLRTEAQQALANGWPLWVDVEPQAALALLDEVDRLKAMAEDCERAVTASRWRAELAERKLDNHRIASADLIAERDRLQRVVDGLKGIIRAGGLPGVEQLEQLEATR